MKINYKESEIYKRTHFLKETPTLSGEEEVIARAGQGEDPWAKESQNPGLYGVHRLDTEGNITPQYKKLLEQLHMDLPTIKPYTRPEPSDDLEEKNLLWRKIQEEKKKSRLEASLHIEKQWILDFNRKLEVIEKAKTEMALLKQIEDVSIIKKDNKKSKQQKQNM